MSATHEAEVQEIRDVVAKDGGWISTAALWNRVTCADKERFNRAVTSLKGSGELQLRHGLAGMEVAVPGVVGADRVTRAAPDAPAKVAAPNLRPTLPPPSEERLEQLRQQILPRLEGNALTREELQQAVSATAVEINIAVEPLLARGAINRTYGKFGAMFSMPAVAAPKAETVAGPAPKAPAARQRPTPAYEPWLSSQVPSAIAEAKKRALEVLAGKTMRGADVFVVANLSQTLWSMTSRTLEKEGKLERCGISMSSVVWRIRQPAALVPAPEAEPVAAAHQEHPALLQCASAAHLQELPEAKGFPPPAANAGLTRLEVSDHAEFALHSTGKLEIFDADGIIVLQSETAERMIRFLRWAAVPTGALA